MKVHVSILSLVGRGRERKRKGKREREKKNEFIEAEIMIILYNKHFVPFRLII